MKNRILFTFFIIITTFLSAQAFKNFGQVQQLFHKLPPFQAIILQESHLFCQPQCLKSFPSGITNLAESQRDSLMHQALQANIPIKQFIELLKQATGVLWGLYPIRDILQFSSNDNFSVFEKAAYFDSNAILHVIGDQHGSFHDTVNFFNTIFYQEEQKSISPFQESSFLLKPEYQNHHWIFCGDLTDGGIYGVETLALILSVFIQNPNNIHIIRGNHEDIRINDRYGFCQELNLKYKENKNRSMEDALLFASLNPLIRTFYDQLPVALWGIFDTKNSRLKTSEETKYDVFLFCHGGIERQDSNIVELCKQCVKSDQKVAYKEVNGNFNDATDVGYLWNDINPNFHEKQTKHSCRGPNCYVLSLHDIAQYMKQQFEHTEFSFRHIFRAHQHQMAYRDLMPIFFQNHGVCQLGDPENPMVTTLLVMPGTFAGIPLEKLSFPGVVEAVPVILQKQKSSKSSIQYEFIALPNDHIPDAIFQSHNAILKKINARIKPSTKHQLPRVILQKTVSKNLWY